MVIVPSESIAAAWIKVLWSCCGSFSRSSGNSSPQLQSSERRQEIRVAWRRRGGRERRCASVVLASLGSGPDHCVPRIILESRVVHCSVSASGSVPATCNPVHAVSL